MKDVNQSNSTATARQKFYDFFNLVFCETLGIKPFHNNKYGALAFRYKFTSQLGYDLGKIKEGKPIGGSRSDYESVLDIFFVPSKEAISKTKSLVTKLSQNGYFTSSINLCEYVFPDTICFFKDIIFDLWKSLEETMLAAEKKEDHETFTIKAEIIDKLIKKRDNGRLLVSFEYYQILKKDYAEQLAEMNPKDIQISSNYANLYKAVLEGNSIHTFTTDELIIFFDSLYTVSDILDQQHNVDSYKINLELLSFFNDFYNDNYENVRIDDIRKIQGCIYGIAKANDDSSIKGDLIITENKNIRKIKPDDNIQQKESTLPEKWNACLTGLTNLLNHEILAPINMLMDSYELISINQMREDMDSLLQGIKMPSFAQKLDVLTTLSLIYSNIAATHMQWLKAKKEKGISDHNYVYHSNMCEKFQKYSWCIRSYLVSKCIQDKDYGPASKETAKSRQSLANCFNTIATRYYYEGKYNFVIALRCILYSFYSSLGLDKKADIQRENTPIAEFIEQLALPSTGTSIVSGKELKQYNDAIADLEYSFGKGFSLDISSLLPYEVYKDSVLKYKASKNPV